LNNYGEDIVRIDATAKTSSPKTELYAVPENHAGKMRVFYRRW